MSDDHSKRSATVFIVDDHDLVRQGMAKLIEATPDLTLAGEADTVEEATTKIMQTPPDVAIIDLSLKQGDGFELIQYIARELPDVRIVVSSMHESAIHIERALRAGAHGYVTKSSPAPMLITAIEAVLNGELYLPGELADRVLRRIRDGAVDAGSVDALSEREREIFSQIGDGLTTRQIAEKLNRSPKTIESHIERIKAKLQVKSASELHRLAYAHQAGLDPS